MLNNMVLKMKVKNASEIREMIMEIPMESRRVFSIAAHIDHGKSTTADYLLAKAGLMSAETAGEKRMTDSDEEEQERGITIFTSVVVLSYEYTKIDSDGNETKEQYLFQINDCLLYTSPSPRDLSTSRMPSSA